jgi:hypothetical protein
MVDEKQRRPLTAVEFAPLDASASRRRFRISPVYLSLGLVLILAALSLAYLLAARAVIFRLDPGHAQVEVHGLSFHIGDNFLLLPGQHEVTAEADGYHPLDTTIDVTGDRTQEAELALEPLPGRLEVDSGLDGIEVIIDGEPAGTAPGLIEDIPRGSHIVEFRKYRYFPLREELEIEGLGRTQSVSVELEPAWGQLQISSVPDAADVMVDGRPVGTTPVTTEVLETGTRLALAKPGYKTWEREVSIKAGSTGVYPPIELEVADRRGPRQRQRRISRHHARQCRDLPVTRSPFRVVSRRVSKGGAHRSDRARGALEPGPRHGAGHWPHPALGNPGRRRGTGGRSQPRIRQSNAGVECPGT